MRRLALAALLVMAAAPLAAQVRPEPSGGDARLQTVLYNPDQVVELQVASGYQLTVELGTDERIENIAVGDSASWQVTPNKRGDHLFVKMAPGAATTNLTVVTDARTYALTLNPSMGVMGDLAFIVRFRYPSPAPNVAGGTPLGEGRYKLAGARILRPASISDNGTHTFLTFAPDQTMPAIFAVDNEGRERLLNGAMRDGRYVIDSVPSRLLFRLDALTATATRIPLQKHR
ncbi:MAG: TrbG/VirB9 family P-type conjugative transfer protein [Sphingomonas sp.]